jgi:hypothetical protein
MATKQAHHQESPGFPEYPLSFYACPNPDCADFNQFAADNLSIAEPMAKPRRFAGCTARPVAHASANEKAHLCNPRSCLRQPYLMRAELICQLDK